MSSTPLFDLVDMTFRYPDAVALTGVTLSITEGERIAVLGANGSGKSTLLRIFAGLCVPEEGSVLFRGRPMTESTLRDESFACDFRRRVGIVFQNPDVQLFNPTVFDEVAFGPMQLGWSRTEVLEKVNVALEEMEIVHLKHRAPHRLSGGEKKRVALASVLVLDPEVLLMDEPTAALDPKSQGHMIDFLFDCAGKKTVITTTHSLEIVEEIAERCVVLDCGRVAGMGASSTILQDQDLLTRTHLIHMHRHRHHGLVHSHPHLSHHHHHPGGANSGT